MTNCTAAQHQEGTGEARGTRSKGDEKRLGTWW